MPAVWREFFSGRYELPASGVGVFVEASNYLGDGLHCETTGAVAAVVEVPENRRQVKNARLVGRALSRCGSWWFFLPVALSSGSA
jgi:hypothetical protein